MDEKEKISLKEIEDRVVGVLDNKINPQLLKHKGWIDLEKIEDNNVYIRFRGGCSGCMSTYDTFNKVVKPELVESVKEIKDVIIVDEVSDELINFAKSLFTKKS